MNLQIKSCEEYLGREYEALRDHKKGKRHLTADNLKEHTALTKNLIKQLSSKIQEFLQECKSAYIVSVLLSYAVGIYPPCAPQA